MDSGNLINLDLRSNSQQYRSLEDEERVKSSVLSSSSASYLKSLRQKSANLRQSKPKPNTETQMTNGTLKGNSASKAAILSSSTQILRTTKSKTAKPLTRMANIVKSPDMSSSSSSDIHEKVVLSLSSLEGIDTDAAQTPESKIPKAFPANKVETKLISTVDNKSREVAKVAAAPTPVLISEVDEVTEIEESIPEEAFDEKSISEVIPSSSIASESSESSIKSEIVKPFTKYSDTFTSMSTVIEEKRSDLDRTSASDSETSANTSVSSTTTSETSQISDRSASSSESIESASEDIPIKRSEKTIASKTVQTEEFFRLAHQPNGSFSFAPLPSQQLSLELQSQGVNVRGPVKKLTAIMLRKQLDLLRSQIEIQWQSYSRSNQLLERWTQSSTSSDVLAKLISSHINN